VSTILIYDTLQTTFSLSDAVISEALNLAHPVSYHIVVVV